MSLPGMDSDAYIIITSDLHLTASEGPFAPTALHFQKFLCTLQERPPDCIFVVGDVVNNQACNSKGLFVDGDLHRWEADTALYEKAKQPLSQTRFVHCLGAGHDFGQYVQIDFAEHQFGKCRGSMRWGRHDLIWLSSQAGGFDHHASQVYPAFEEADYSWLRDLLSSSQSAVLLFHLPLLTPDTAEIEPSGSYEYSIDPRDPIYTIIRSNSERISAIFNGHIHHRIRSSYCGIPVYISPFHGKYTYCRLEGKFEGILRVMQLRCAPPAYQSVPCISHDTSSHVADQLDDADWEISIRAASVAYCLSLLPPGQRLALYGCGQLAKVLLASFPAPIKRHTVTFLASLTPTDSVFADFPTNRPSSLKSEDLDYVLLLSENFEREMLDSISFIDDSKILLLSHMMRLYTLNIPFVKAIPVNESSASLLPFTCRHNYRKIHKLNEV